MSAAGRSANNNSLDAEGQTKQILVKVDDCPAKCGTDKSKLLTATIYPTNMAKSQITKKLTWLGSLVRPARACQHAARLAGNAGEDYRSAATQ